MRRAFPILALLVGPAFLGGASAGEPGVGVCVVGETVYFTLQGFDGPFVGLGVALGAPFVFVSWSADGFDSTCRGTGVAASLASLP